MNVLHLDRSFAHIGARVCFGDGPIDILRDADGEFFRLDLATAQAGGYEALDVQPRRRHLILASTERFLCGHDERHWFVAGLPERRITTVSQAMDALMPAEAREGLLRHKVPSRKRHRRHNPAYLRQGEWFFLPAPDFQATRIILRD